MPEFNFEQRLKQDILLLTALDDFYNDIQKITKKYNFPPDKKANYETDIAPVVEEGYFNHDILDLMGKYNLKETHEFILSSYLVNGHMNFDLPTDLWYLNPYTVSMNTKDCITLKIYPETSLEDIKRNWPRIKRAKDNLLNKPISRKRSIPNLERDLEVLRLKRAGNSYNEIKKITNDKYPKQKIYNYPDISKILQRLKQKAEELLLSFKET